MATPRKPTAAPSGGPQPSLQRPAPQPPRGQQATPQQQGGQSKAPPPGTKGEAPSKPGAPPQGQQSGGARPPVPSKGGAGNPPPPQGGKPSGPPPGPGNPEPPPELPKGPSEELASAYEFLQKYTAEMIPGSVPPQLPPGMLSSIYRETMQSPLAAGMSNVLPKSDVTGRIKTYPDYPIATGSIPSPNLPTGQLPPELLMRERNLIGGLNPSEVRINQKPVQA